LIHVAASLPIFPLNTVLFPGGALPLRVFEARYMDMIRRAMREGSEFGVCLISKGREAGDHGVETEEIGCRARIADWNMEQLGVLQIETTGTERFEIVSRHVESDGLLVANVIALEPEPAVPVPAEAAPCQVLLQRIVQRLDDDLAKAAEDDEDIRAPLGKPYLFDDATWVGNRLSEVLPISLSAKQKLMALTDGPTRLSIVLRYLQQHRIV
jgi:Lon protease-like protein